MILLCRKSQRGMKRKGRKRIEGKSPAPGGNRTLDLTITDLSTNMQGIRPTIPLSLEIQFFLFEIETGTGPVIFFGIHATGNLLRKLRRGLFSETKKRNFAKKNCKQGKCRRRRTGPERFRFRFRFRCENESEENEKKWPPEFSPNKNLRRPFF